MSTDSTITPDVGESVPTDFDDAFDAWLGGATIAKRSVTVYGKPGLFARFQELDERRKIAEAATNGEDTLGDDEVGDILDEWQAVYDEWIESKSTWVIRALTDDETEQVRADTPVRADLPPLANAKDKTAEERAVHAAELKALEKQRQVDKDDENLRGLAMAVESITFSDGRVKNTITVDQLHRMGQTLGTRQMQTLMLASLQAAVEDPLIPAPFSRSTSSDDQTS